MRAKLHVMTLSFLLLASCSGIEEDGKSKSLVESNNINIADYAKYRANNSIGFINENELMNEFALTNKNNRGD